MSPHEEIFNEMTSKILKEIEGHPHLKEAEHLAVQTVLALKEFSSQPRSTPQAFANTMAESRNHTAMLTRAILKLLDSVSQKVKQ
ncbi:MAG TPA: hypothetical protein V6C65_26180 [Allocoleopsis sp.]